MTSGAFQKSERQGGFSPGVFKREQSGGETSGGDKTISSLIKSICIGFGAALILLFLTSVAASFYDIPEFVLNYIVIAVSLICLFMVGFKAAGYNGKNGLLIGVIAGVVYAVIVYLIGWLGFKSISFSPEAIANFAVGGAVSGLGGVVGINRYTKKKRKR